MKALRTVFVFGIVLAFAALAVSAMAPSDDAKEWQKVLEKAKISLVDAIQKAEKETGGKAIGAEMELEGKTVIMDVIILKGGDDPKLVEVEVNGETGAVQEIEEGDDDDDDGGDDDDDDDDDEEEDDD